MAKMMSASTSITQPPPISVRTIPGGYGWPVLGPISDRLNYFWFQGPETFFRKRIEKSKSTVFRTNVPPTFPLFTGVNPNVIAVLDVKSFSHLFDMDVVEKKDTLVGDFMPSVSFTGGMRVCAYLDTSEPKHSKIKGFAMDILRRSSATWVPTLLSKLDSMWSTIDSKFNSSSSANYLVPLQQCLFGFLAQCFVGADPAASPNIADHGYAMIDLWLGLMLLPTVKIGFLQPLEEIFLHSFAYPSLLVSGGYNKLAKFVEEEGWEVVERGQREFGLTRDEAVHNVLFVLGFNAFGGFSIFFPSLLGTLGSDTTIQESLRAEVRAKGGSTLSFDSIKDMELVQSFVYETLRLNPPVPTQYGRARKDFLLSSHDSVFEIKKGELLCGYQPLVMRDPKVFDEPEKFIFDRFTKEKGSELLRYLYWSNGPQTGSPSESNKQCPAKDYVPLTASLFVAHLLRRYDSITCNSSGSITALVKAK
ncbi:Fatty acid hydroperoxide lyase [Actinidia chinensis var. chinensis]|uniref:Fatty acid hydroperoxide lyase n=1 Tax=Actinidia chinensis var. chinensis TaxID=1590841 RepID=A0A2R6PQI4_ACTCC|nr:Fatty acid hydroperoxide lyase [Actinidia chinensis var. chinensis]